MAAVHSCDMFASRIRGVLTEQAFCNYTYIRSYYLVLFQGDVECLQHMSFCIYRPFDIPILPFVHGMHVFCFLSECQKKYVIIFLHSLNSLYFVMEIL